MAYTLFAPEKDGSSLFSWLNFLQIGRNVAALIILIITFILGTSLFIIFAIRVRWNNTHLSLPVIEIRMDFLRINNYKKPIDIPFEDIVAICIFGKGKFLEIETISNKCYSPKYLNNNRLAYKALSEILPDFNKSISFEDWSTKRDK